MKEKGLKKEKWERKKRKKVNEKSTERERSKNKKLYIKKQMA
jgi:hypothetical protein